VLRLEADHRNETEEFHVGGEGIWLLTEKISVTKQNQDD